VFNCKICQQKDKEIEYLKKLVDNLLLNKSIAPVDNQEIILEDTEQEKEDRALAERGAVRYGD